MLSNANGIIIKPSVKSLRYNSVSNFFFASRSMEQTGNSFGFVSTEVGINNNSTYITGIGAAVGTSNTSSTTNSYETILGMGASTTGNIYGVYDINGGATEYVMGIYNKTTASSGFTTSTFPNEKYYNNYTTTSYQGHALTETQGWYKDSFSFVSSSSPYFRRGGHYSNTLSAGIFNVYYGTGASTSENSIRMVVTNE